MKLVRKWLTTALLPKRPRGVALEAERATKMGWFSKIQNRDEAMKIAKDCSTGLFVMAGMQGVLGVWLEPMLLADAAILAIGGFFIRKSFSRTAAIIVLLLSLISFVTTFTNRFGDSGSGSNIILTTILLWVAVRSVETTFKLHGRFKETASVGEQSVPPT